MALLVFLALTVLTLGLLGRRGSDRIRFFLFAAVLLAPAAFHDGARRWVQDQLPDVPTATTTTSTTLTPTSGP